jgi:hypothetical protein
MRFGPAVCSSSTSAIEFIEVSMFVDRFDPGNHQRLVFTENKVYGPFCDVHRLRHLHEDNELSRTVHSRPVQVLKPHTGAEPQIYYISLPEEVNR